MGEEKKKESVLAPFARLHLAQAATKFCTLVAPPLDQDDSGRHALRRGTAAAEALLHLALSAGPGHAFAALIAGKAADCIPASVVLCLNHCGSDGEWRVNDTGRW